MAAGLDKTSKRSLLLRWCRVVTVEYDVSRESCVVGTGGSRIYNSVSSRSFCKRGHNFLFKILGGGGAPCSVGV